MEPNPNDVLAQARAAVEQAELDRVESIQREEAIVRLMGERWGRAFVWSLFNDAGLFGPSHRYDGQDRWDTHRVAHAEGERWFAGRLWSRCRAVCPEALVQLLAEHLVPNGRNTQPD